MKKEIILLLTAMMIVITPTCIVAKVQSEEASEDTFDFRNTNWGISRKEVIQSEEANPAMENKDSLAFTDIKLGEKDVTAFYAFDNDELIRGSYTIDETHINPLKYLDDYNELKELYIEKYGEPLSDDQIWNDKTFSDDLGYSLMFGYVSYMTMWTTETTSICFYLGGDTGDINFYIYYTDINYIAPKNTDGV